MPDSQAKALKQNHDFDVVIVGAGPAGLTAAHYLAEHSNLKILIIEKGRDVPNRTCPIAKHGDCKKCRPCNILSGVGGAGLFSDGKLNYIEKLGKTDLTQFMDRDAALALIQETEDIFNHFGMDGPVYPTDMQTARRIRKNARKHGMELLLIRQKHLGSDNLPRHIARFTQSLKDRGVTIHTSETARDLDVHDNTLQGVVTNRAHYIAKAAILAPGRVGADWMGQLAEQYNLGVEQRGIEAGVRVEVHKDILADITDIIYDPTFFIQTTTYDDQTRTFCTNRQGYVSQENYQNFVCVNGHAYADKKSENSNFAFLSKIVLTEPVSDNQAYGEAIGRLATIIGDGKPILQRFGDLRRGRRSTWNRVKKGYIEPTLKNVVCGDIAMALPERILRNILEGLHMLDRVIPGVANDETLLYAPEIKFFATQIHSDNNLQTRIKNLHIAGDGPGVAGNIISAAATALIPAKYIIDNQ